MLLKYHFFYRDNIEIIRYVNRNRPYSYVYNTNEKNWTKRVNNPFYSFNGDFFQIIANWIGKYDKSFPEGAPKYVEISPIPEGKETFEMIEESQTIDQYIGII